MKKSILRERRERYYEELRKIGLMDESKEDNIVEKENEDEKYIEETNENETVQEEKPLETSKKLAKTGKKKVVND